MVSSYLVHGRTAGLGQNGRGTIGLRFAEMSIKSWISLKESRIFALQFASRLNATMRTIPSLLVCLASQLGAVAAASLTDVCSVGFCTLNGGQVCNSLNNKDVPLTVCSTSGGKGGATVTVSTLEALESAVTGNDPRIVVVSGTISGAKRVYVGSNKSIIGRNGSKSRLPQLP